MTCDIKLCGGVCCTFLTMHWPIRTDEIRAYFHLHGIECKNDSEGGLWLKMPLPCRNFNHETKQCTDYNNRPLACRNYPQTKSPFIDPDLCTQLEEKKNHSEN